MVLPGETSPGGLDALWVRPARDAENVVGIPLRHADSVVTESACPAHAAGTAALDSESAVTSPCRDATPPPGRARPPAGRGSLCPRLPLRVGLPRPRGVPPAQATDEHAGVPGAAVRDDHGR